MIHKGSVIRVKGNESDMCNVLINQGPGMSQSGANESVLHICSVKVSHAAIR